MLNPENDPSSCSYVVVVVVVEEVDVVVDIDEVTWIFQPITCDENMTHKKDSHQFCQPGENATNPVNFLMIKCLSDVDDFRLTMIVVLVVIFMHVFSNVISPPPLDEQVRSKTVLLEGKNLHFDDVCLEQLTRMALV